MKPWKTFVLGAIAGAFLVLWAQLGLEMYAKGLGWTVCGDGTFRAVGDSPVRIQKRILAPLPPLEVRH